MQHTKLSLWHLATFYSLSHQPSSFLVLTEYLPTHHILLGTPKFLVISIDLMNLIILW
jgi:hypothetical protein